MRRNSTLRVATESGTQEQPAGTSPETALFPYRPSWVNRLIRWINRLPFPPWLFYTGLFCLLTTVLMTANWIGGLIPLGSFNSPFLYTWIGFYAVIFLAAIHHTDEVALHSFEAFLPALGVSETEAAHLRYELTTLPARATWIVAPLGAVGIVLVIFLGDYGEISRNYPLTFGTAVFLAFLGFTMTAEMLYHTFRQLRLVNHIHNIATNIDLLHPAPLYAFSNLSARTGLIFLLILWFDLVFNPETFVNPVLVLINFLGLGLFSVACFILPLMGMHRRLVREKLRLQLEVNQRIKASFKQLYQRVDGAELHDADPLNKSINSLISAHDFIAKIPTWPWKPETFALFFSAVTFPIIVFVIQMFLKNFLGFQ